MPGDTCGVNVRFIYFGGVNVRFCCRWDRGGGTPGYLIMGDGLFRRKKCVIHSFTYRHLNGIYKIT